MNRRLPRNVLVGICTLHAILLAYGAFVHSPTYNESAHLAAAISYWQFGRFDVYSVNPPLIKLAAALPVLAVGCETDWSAFYAGPGARPEMSLGELWVKANGERSLWLVTLARWACLPFSLLGALVCYAWARDLAGAWSGVLAASLWCFSPNVLAHAQLCTPDAHATALGAAACYTFWRWLKDPTWLQAILTGFVLGLAELSKTTLVIFYPVWPLLWVAYRWLQPTDQRPTRDVRSWLREAGMLALRMGVGIYVLNLGYGFEGSFTPLREYQFVSHLFVGGDHAEKSPNGDGQAESRAAEHRGPRNRFAGTWWGHLPVPFPKHYLVGIDLQQMDFEHYGCRSYLAGTFQQGGWWYYYLYVLAVKVPIGMWLLANLAIVSAVWLLCHRRGLSLRDQMILLVVPGVIFAVVSAKSGFSEHGRYILPCMPMFVIWVSVTLSTAIATSGTVARYFVTGVTSCALLWSFGSVARVYPHTLSYFNEIAGGPIGGPKHLLHSNIDWGQDLVYLKRWIQEHPEARPLHMAVFTGFDPAAVGFADVQPIGQENPDPGKPLVLRPGWYAVSVNLLYGYGVAARDGKTSGSADSRLIAVLRERTPAARAGYSIYIYHLEKELAVANTVPEESGK